MPVPWGGGSPAEESTLERNTGHQRGRQASAVITLIIRVLPALGMPYPPPSDTSVQVPRGLTFLFIFRLGPPAQILCT